MKILVTGASGFIGSSLVKFLVNKSIDIYCLVRKTSLLEQFENVKNKIKFVYGDITQKDTLPQAVKNIDLIIHCAGVIRATNIETYYRVNQFGTRNLVDVVNNYNPNLKGFIHISSQAAAGPCIKLYFKNEKENCTPVSHYGRSKLLSELETKNLSDKIKTIILRPAAVYGPYDKDMFVYFKYASKGFLPVFTKEFCVQLIFVNDLIEICWRIVNNIDRVPSGTYFVAEEKCYNIQQLKTLFSQVVNKKVFLLKIPYWIGYLLAAINETVYKNIYQKPAIFNRDKLNELVHKYWLCNSSNIKQILNFNYTPLYDGIKLTYLWYKENNWL